MSKADNNNGNYQEYLTPTYADLPSPGLIKPLSGSGFTVTVEAKSLSKMLVTPADKVTPSLILYSSAISVVE